MANIYRPPNSNEAYLNNLTDLIQFLTNRQGQTLITGDFNFPHINWITNTLDFSNPQSRIFHDSINENLLFQNITEFTRKRGNDTPSTLDLVFTKTQFEIENIIYNSPLGNSDHATINFEFLIDTEQNQDLEDQLNHSNDLNYYKGDYDAISNAINQINWNLEFEEKNMEEKWEKFKSIYHELTKKYIPKKINHRGNRKKKWISKKLLKLIKEKNKCWNKYRKNRSQRNYDKYKSLRNKVTNENRKTRENFENNLAEEIKNNPRSFYSYVRSATNLKDKIPKLSKDDGSSTSDNKEKCIILNDTFTKVFINENDNIPNFPQVTQSKLSTIQIDKNDIIKFLTEIRSHSSGPDNIKPVVLKNCANSISIPLQLLFKESIEKGELPKDWKQSNVVPIFKKGSKTNPSNYRPISITSIVVRIFEKLIKTKLIKHLQNNNLITKHQHGFQKNKSTTTQLLEFQNDLTKSVDNKNSVDVIFLDCQKAFDTVPHKRLLNKIKAFGINDNLLNWIKGYLTNRQQRVVLNNSSSDWSEVKSGVPQGSVLGPILFNIYINDLFKDIKAKGKLFADDAKLYSEVNNQNQATELQNDLNTISGWSNKWLLKFNISKCSVMHFGKNNKRYNYVLDENILKDSNSEKDLGVITTTNLKPKQHIGKITNKAKSVLGMINSTFRYIKTNNMPTLYKSLVRPHLEYAAQTWSPYYQYDIDRLESVQRKATKMAKDVQHLDYESRLERFDLTKLYDRRQRGDLIQTYRILNGIDDLNIGDFFIMSEDIYPNTRGHKHKIYKPITHTATRQNFFSIRTINTWNSLPFYIVNSKTIST